MKGDLMEALHEIEKAHKLDPNNSLIAEAHDQIRGKAA